MSVFGSSFYDGWKSAVAVKLMAAADELCPFPVFCRSIVAVFMGVAADYQLTSCLLKQRCP